MSAADTPAGDERLMAVALALAASADHRTSPNPMVGAVVARDGAVVATGVHRQAGGPHAEVDALEAAGARAAGADLYVTLEPCSHHGRTPPCVDAIVAAGVRRCVVAMVDPNVLVNGRGIERLRAAGIIVEVGVGGDDAARLNEFYITHATTGLPFVTVKFAVSLDGRTATRTGESRWISSAESRERVHRMRSAHDAVLVGAGTAVRDDPALTTRLEGGGRSPLRVVLDTHLRVPPGARLFHQDRGAALAAVGRGAPPARIAEHEAQGIRVVCFPEVEGRVDIAAVLRHLAEQGCLSVLVEGGAQVHGSVLGAHLADKVTAFVAPLVIGGATAPGAVGGVGPEHLAEALRLRRVEIERVGADVLVSGYCR